MASPTASVLVGTVRAFRPRQEQFGEVQIQVWNFQVEQSDPSGNLILRPVEMRGVSIVGDVHDGQSVEVFGLWKDGILQASVIRNTITGATIRVNQSKNYVFAIFITAVFTVAFWSIAIIGGRTPNLPGSGFFGFIAGLMALLPTVILIFLIRSAIRESAASNEAHPTGSKSNPLTRHLH